MTTTTIRRQQNIILFIILSTTVIIIPTLVSKILQFVIVPTMLICFITQCTAITKTTTNGVYRARLTTTKKNWFNLAHHHHDHHPAFIQPPLLQVPPQSSSRHRAFQAKYIARRSVSSLSVSSETNNKDCKSNTDGTTTNGFKVSDNNNNNNKANTMIGNNRNRNKVGTLVSRIMPRSFVEYDLMKPDKYKLNSQTTSDLLREYNKQPRQELSSSRSSSSDDSSSWSSSLCQVIHLPTSQEEQEEHDLMKNDNKNNTRSFDNWIVSLNIDFDVKFDLDNGQLLLFDDDEEEELPSAVEKEGDQHTNTESPPSSSKEEPHQEEEQQVHHLSIHMNRNANEPATRTIKRLEISAVRKIESEQRKLYHQHEKINGGNTNVMFYVPKKEASRNNKLRAESIGSITDTTPTRANKMTSSVLVPSSCIVDVKKGSTGDGSSSSGSSTDEEDIGASDELLDGYSTLKVSNLKTSTKLWYHLATAVESDVTTRNSSILSVSLHALQQQAIQQQQQGHNTSDSVDDSNNVSNKLLLQINACPPTILSVKTFEQFESQIFVGVPLVIRTEVLHATHAIIVWFVDKIMVKMNSPCYTPTETDIGKQISVLIIPTRNDHNGIGYEEAYYFQNNVEPLPYMPLVSPLRDEWSKPRSHSAAGDDDLRVMTFNLLADLYTGREVDQQLMYCHCHPKFLRRCRRMPMLLYEVLSYDADIICLQEVDASIFTNLLEPALRSQGYQGYYSNKASSQLEGCAMFWSLKCFDYASSDDQGTYPIRDLFGNNNTMDGTVNRKEYSKWDSMDNIDKMLDGFPELKKVTREKVGQILQVATLTVKKSSDGKRDDDERPVEEQRDNVKPDKIVVANTHLFYHPMADHIRAMQAYVVCKQIDTVRHRHLLSSTSTSTKTQTVEDNEEPQYPYPLVFCGDLNSNPLSGAVHLLLQRRIGPDHFQTWKHLHEYEWGMGEYDFMIEHGYIGNYPPVACSNGSSTSNNGSSSTSNTTSSDEFMPQFIEDEFVDAREYEEDDEDYGGGGQQSQGDDNSISTSPPSIVLPTTFPNLFSAYRSLPPFTNYAVDFIETLDYILASEPNDNDAYGFSPSKSAPMPSESDIKKYIAMPNEFMPSDHVSMLCDLKWEKHNKKKVTSLSSRSLKNSHIKSGQTDVYEMTKTKSPFTDTTNESNTNSAQKDNVVMKKMEMSFMTKNSNMANPATHDHCCTNTTTTPPKNPAA